MQKQKKRRETIEYSVGGREITLTETMLQGPRPTILYTGAEALEEVPGEVHERIRKELVRPYAEMKSDAKSGERSIIHTLDKPLELDGITLGAVKLKAVRIGPGIPLEEYFGEGRPEALLAFMNDKIIAFKSEPRPTGGMLLSRAKNEYDMTFCARKDGLPVGYPIAYGVFPDIDFQGKQVGFVVIGVEDAQDKRISGNTEEEMIRICSPRTLMDQMLVPGKTVRMFESAFGLVGRTLRRFNDAGYVDASPGYWNYSVKEGKARKYDLDLTFLKGKSSESAIIGYQLTDLGGAMWSIQNHLNGPLEGGMTGVIKRTGADVVTPIAHKYFHDMLDDPRLESVTLEGIDEALKQGWTTPLNRVQHDVVSIMKDAMRKQK